MSVEDSAAGLALEHLGRCAAVYEEEEGTKPPEPWGLGFVIGFLAAYNLEAVAVAENERLKIYLETERRQLRKVDEELAWENTGRCRIETIQDLKVLADPLAMLERLALGFGRVQLGEDHTTRFVLRPSEERGFLYWWSKCGQPRVCTRAEADALLKENLNTCPESSLLAWGQHLLERDADE